MASFFPGAEIRVVPDGIRAFGNTNLSAAEHVAGAGAMDLQANITSLSPAMGLIGGEFLAAFVAAQSEHTRTVGQLSWTYASNGVAAHESATEYEVTDASTAAALAQAGDDL